MDKLPSGMLPSDKSIEFFADPERFGKLYWMSQGVIHKFKELPLSVMDDLRDELACDIRALKGLRLMGIHTEDDMLEQYNYCNRGSLDAVPDISVTGKKSKEFVDCGRHGHCPGENKVCSPLCINGEHITHREFECLKLIGIGLTYKRITIEMGFRRETAVNSLIERIREKLHCCTITEIALKVRDLGLV
jgi:DNA-binding CsgD family transcriptional regulator